jgi:NAD(P)H-dependent FMN reductase
MTIPKGREAKGISMTPPTVVAISGSLRDESYTRVALEHVLAAARENGADTVLLDLREYDLPVFDPDHEDAGDAPEVRGELREADSILLGTPMYHGSFSAPLKNAMDYSGFDEFEDTTVGLLGVAGGRFPTTALDHLRLVCRALDAWVLPHQVAIPSAYSEIDDGEFEDPDLADRVEVLGKRLVEYAHIEPDPPAFESTENVGADD